MLNRIFYLFFAVQIILLKKLRRIYCPLLQQLSNLVEPIRVLNRSRFNIVLYRSLQIFIEVLTFFVKITHNVADRGVHFDLSFGLQGILSLRMVDLRNAFVEFDCLVDVLRSTQPDQHFVGLSDSPLLHQFLCYFFCFLLEFLYL